MKLTLKGGAAVDPDSGKGTGVSRVSCGHPVDEGNHVGQGCASPSGLKAPRS